MPNRGRGDTVAAVSKAATVAVLEPGTEVSPTTIGGQARGPLGLWAVVLHRVRRPLPDQAAPDRAGPDPTEVTGVTEGADPEPSEAEPSPDAGETRSG